MQSSKSKTSSLIFQEMNDYHAMGFPTLCFNWYRDSRGKKQFVNLPDYHQTISLNDCLVRGREKCVTPNGLGILCGERSGIVVLDIDVSTEENIPSGLDYWKSHKKDFPKTPMVRSSSGGYHIYFNWHPLVTSKRTAITLQGKRYHIDVITDKCFIVVPPSKWKSEQYEWIHDFSDVPIANIPDFLLNDLIPPPKLHTIQPPTTFIKNTDLLKLVMLLSTKRLSDYNSWLSVGMALYHTSETDDYKDIWKIFSQQNMKLYDEFEIDKKWDTFYTDSQSTLGIGSIYHWAKEDNPNKYIELYPKLMKHSIKEYAKQYEDKLFCHYNDIILNKQIKDINMVKAFFTQTVCKVTVSNQFYAIKRLDDYGFIEWQFCKKSPFMDGECVYIRDKETEGEYKPRILDKILKETDLKWYEGICFDPKNLPRNSNKLNLFTGFDTEPYHKKVEDSEIKIFLDHIKDVLANGNEESYQYQLKWHAHLLQRPGQKIKTALLLQSEKQQVGKSIFSENIIKKLIGEKYIVVCKNAGELVEKFNYYFLNKLMVILDEACTTTNSNDKKEANQLKNRITQTDIMIEIKNGPKWKDTDHCNYIFLSNEENPVSIEYNDKRFACFEVSEHRCLDKPYFDALSQAFDNKKMCKKLMRYLMDIDLTEWNPQIMPETEFRIHLRNRNRNIVDLFLINAKNGEIPDLNIFQFNKTNDLYISFINWCMQNRESSDISCKSFARRLSKYAEFQQIQKQRCVKIKEDLISKLN